MCSSPEQVVKFVLDMHKGIKVESNLDADGSYYTVSQTNSDKAIVKERLHRISSDIARFSTAAHASGVVFGISTLCRVRASCS